MKTTNSVQKTENSSIRKSVVIALALLFSLGLITSNVSARETENKAKHNNSMSQVAGLNETNRNEQLMNLRFLAASIYEEAIHATDAYFLENSVESQMEVEDWMTNELNFITPMAAEEVENELGVEEWMINEQNFISPLTTETDPALEVEEWMMDESIWGK